MSDTALDIQQIHKTYKSGFTALENVNLSIRAGEIFALLGPNGAGKTTLISIICGIVNASSGRVLVGGFDSRSSYREARQRVGLVPQELSLSMFESVWATVRFSRGLYGKAPNDAYLESLLKSLSLWDKKDSRIMALSGGMKRRVLIAKALAHEPEILFLDEPTAGVDVALRQDMWAMIRGLKARGVTIILTTHYIDEAEDMADRIGVINEGKIMLVEDKHSLMQKLGRRQLILTLPEPRDRLPDSLADLDLSLEEGGMQLVYQFDSQSEGSGIRTLLRRLDEVGVEFRDLHTEQSSLEDIFVSLIGGAK